MKRNRFIVALVLIVISLNTYASGYVVSSEERKSFFDHVHLNPIFSSTSDSFGLIGYRIKDLKKISIFYRVGMRENDIIISFNKNKFSRRFAAGDLEKLVNSESVLVFEVKKPLSEKTKFITITFK